MKKIIIAFLIFSNTAFAVDPAANATLSAINVNIAAQLTEMKKMYDLVIKEFEQLQTSGETLKKLNDIYKEYKVQRDAVKNFGDADSWKKKVEKDFKGLNNLKELDNPNLSDEKKMDIISRAIDNRIVGAKDSDRTWLITQKALFDAQQLMNRLKDGDQTPDPVHLNSLIGIKEHSQSQQLLLQAIKDMQKNINSTFRQYRQKR